MRTVVKQIGQRQDAEGDGEARRCDATSTAPVPRDRGGARRGACEREGRDEVGDAVRKIEVETAVEVVLAEHDHEMHHRLEHGDPNDPGRARCEGAVVEPAASSLSHVRSVVGRMPPGSSVS